MPLSPYVWQLSDYLTATLLNSELYTTKGVQFSPNGIAFHAGRPLYKGTLENINAVAVATSTWEQLGKQPTYDQFFVVSADTASRWGARMDPNQAGVPLLNLANSGGAPGTPGGLGLMTAFIPVVTGAANIRSGIGPTSGAGPAITGTISFGNASQQTAPWAVDIVDMNGAGAQTGWIYSDQASPGVANNSTDGSGRVARMGLHWASVYPANGSTVSSAAPRTSWASPPAMTASSMNGSAGLGSILNLLNMPPLLRVASNGTTSIPNNSPTVVSLPGATYDTYSKWNNSSDTYTAPLTGLYFVAGMVPFDNIGATYTQTALQINGTNIWGPRNPTNSGAISCAGKAGIFDLQSGDTIKLAVQQNSGSTQSTSAAQSSLLIVLYLGGSGNPAYGTGANPPDMSYRWKAGTAQSRMTALMNAHIANDLNFLSNPPYLLSYQTTNQGYSAGSDFVPTMDTRSGLVHGTAGDPWSGWDNANHRWQAPVNGWYLAVQETFFVQPNTTTGVAAAKFGLANSGNSSVDTYGISNIPSTVGSGGATAIGYYYLRAGDWIEPVANQSAGTSGLTTSGTSGVNSHFECIWIGE